MTGQDRHILGRPTIFPFELWAGCRLETSVCQSGVGSLGFSMLHQADAPVGLSFDPGHDDPHLCGADRRGGRTPDLMEASARFEPLATSSADAEPAPRSYRD